VNYVQPIRDPELITDIKKYLRETNERNYILFVLGINTGLRISDILKLRVKDVRGTHISMRETKTGKQKRILINPTLKNELKGYIEGKDGDEYLIKSRQGYNKPISREMAYKLLNQAAKVFGLEEIGTHTMRKTFGYHHYLKYKNIALLMDIFNHSSERITLRYIGVNQDTMDNTLSRFSL